ncbi:MAG: phosphopantothenoylcysteine decarboxylase [Eubacteriales bacterium]
MLEYAHGKLERKLIDMIVANNVTEAGAGFGTATNIRNISHQSRRTGTPF